MQKGEMQSLNCVRCDWHEKSLFHRLVLCIDDHRSLPFSEFTLLCHISIRCYYHRSNTAANDKVWTDFCWYNLPEQQPVATQWDVSSASSVCLCAIWLSAFVYIEWKHSTHATNPNQVINYCIGCSIRELEKLDYGQNSFIWSDELCDFK